MDIENVIHLNNSMPSALGKEETSIICENMDKYLGHHSIIWIEINYSNKGKI